MQEKTVSEPNVTVFYDRILTTVNYKKETSGGILLGDGEKGIPYTKQVVVACGHNSNVSVGDEIELNFSLFPVKRTTPSHKIGPDNEKIVLPLEQINGEDYFFISSREVKWIYNK